jgi:anti-sigma regulatory factor (Ser/Thr protein kinase)
MNNQMRFPIGEASAAAEARREATGLARAIGFDEGASGRVAIVVTEAATNLAKHAVEGELLLRAFERDGVATLEALALDRGPGIANVGACMRDGFSTAGSQGAGLGAIQRLANEFDIYSTPGKGTTLVARVCSRKPAESPGAESFDIGGVCIPKAGELVSGDAWGSAWRDGRCLLLVADGLGHGPDAASASIEAVNTFRANTNLTPKELIERAHDALRGTRGAAVAIAELDSREIRYAGVGNISGVTIAPDGDHHMVSHNGIVGYEMRKVQEFIYSWSPETTFVMHSDGLASRWDLRQYPGLASRSPALIAGVLYRDFNRGRDDITVVVVKKR